MTRFGYRLLWVEFRLIEGEKDVLVLKQGSVSKEKKFLKVSYLLLPKLIS